MMRNFEVIGVLATLTALFFLGQLIMIAGG